MAVPNTTTFSLNDVRLEIGLASNSNLSACFSNANSAGFNSLYEGSKNALLNFRDYDHSATVNSLIISPTAYTETSGNGGSFTMTVTSNIGWSVSDNATWISFSGNSNSGNDTFTVSIATNPGSFRTGTLTVAGSGITRTCTIQQPPGSA